MLQFYCVLTDLVFVKTQSWSGLFWYKPHCFSCENHVVLMLTSLYLHMKRNEVCIKTK